MLRNQIIWLALFSLTAAPACKKQTIASSVLDEESQENEMLAAFVKATKSPSVFDTFFSPIWLVEEKVNGKALQACAIYGGIQNVSASGHYETLFIPKECLLDPTKPDTADISIVFTNNKNSNTKPLPVQDRLGKAFRLPIHSRKDAPCTLKENKPWEKLRPAQKVPGIEMFDKETGEELLKSEDIFINRQTAIVLIKTEKGSHIFPSPEVCGLGSSLSEVKGKQKNWAQNWMEIVHTETSYFNDVNFYDTKLMNESNNYWYRNYVKHYLDKNSGGNALEFKMKKDATEAKDRIENASEATDRIKAEISKYLKVSSIAKIVMIPTLHLDQGGVISCFSMQFETEASSGDSLSFQPFQDWPLNAEKNAFTGITHYSISEAPPSQVSPTLFQIRYNLGRYRLEDRADEAAILIPLNGTKDGYPLCYSDACQLRLGAEMTSQKSCEQLIKESWAN